MDNFGPHLKVVLKEMCSRVGFDPKDNWEYFHEPAWFWNYDWSRGAEESFLTWLTNYFFNNKEARDELTTCLTRDKECCRKAAQSFVWNHGWKVSDG